MMKRWMMAMGLPALTVSAALAQDAKVTYVHDGVTGEDAMPSAIQQDFTVVVAEPRLADNGVPPTMTVRTAALLELHAMRKSAVDLCIQLPTKYRTRLPECAEIFKHEIRLQAMAKDKK